MPVPSSLIPSFLPQLLLQPDRKCVHPSPNKCAGNSARGTRTRSTLLNIFIVCVLIHGAKSMASRDQPITQLICSTEYRSSAFRPTDYYCALFFGKLKRRWPGVSVCLRPLNGSKHMSNSIDRARSHQQFICALSTFSVRADCGQRVKNRFAKEQS